MIKIATLVGCAIGDALGNPFEMKSAESPAIQEWDGLFKAGGTFWVGEPGQYTDDTLMSIALSTSLIEKQGFDPDDVAQKYLAWYDSGNTRGIGGTTASALMHYKMGATWQESGLTHNPDGTPTGGNGTAMRAAPLGLWYRNDHSLLLKNAMLDASITHRAASSWTGRASRWAASKYSSRAMARNERAFGPTLAADSRSAGFARGQCVSSRTVPVFGSSGAGQARRP